MKYKVKNITSGEEVLCEKVVVDGFDYYIDKTKPIEVDKYYFSNQAPRKCIKVIAGKYPYIYLNDNGEEVGDSIHWKGVIVATTNKSLDLLMVVDELKVFAEAYSRKTNGIGYDDEHPNYGDTLGECSIDDFTNGYLKAKETYSFAKEDMVELIQSLKDYTHESHNILGHDERESEEFFELWKEQRTIKVLVK